MMQETAAQATLLTIGYSTHEVDEFVALLRRHDANAVADVRSAPYSRWRPQFNRDGSRSRKIALMCAEKDPLNCHRALLIAPELLRQGMQVAHILEGNYIHKCTNSPSLQCPPSVIPASFPSFPRKRESSRKTGGNAAPIHIRRKHGRQTGA